MEHAQAISKPWNHFLNRGYNFTDEGIQAASRHGEITVEKTLAA
jgi:hypothetical protein